MSNSQSSSEPARSTFTATPWWREAAPGLIIATVAVVAMLGARELPLGTAQHLGPGAAPALLAALLLILGLIIAVQALLRARGRAAR